MRRNALCLLRPTRTGQGGGMSELPQGWQECALENISSDISYGYTAKSNPMIGDARMLRITDIQDNKVDWSQVPFCEISESDKDKYLLRKWDLVFARTGATVGKSFLIRDEAPNSVFASYLIRVRSINNEMASYLSRFFDSQAYWRQITEFSAGIGQPNVNGTKLKSLRVPIAPLNEQKRIADKLDAVLARVDACRDRLDRLPAILKRFRQSVLAAATSGKLTEDWRKESNLSDPITTTLGEWCDVLGGKRLPKGFELTNENTGHPYVRVTDFAGFSVKLAQLRFVPSGAAEVIKRYIINSDDVYISIAGTIGLVGQVPHAISGSNLTENAARIVAREGFVPRFLMYQLAAPAAQDQMQQKKIATTQDKLGLFRIKELELLMPSVDEQTEIVRRVEALFAYADRLEARHAAARAQVEKLTPATLAKAFRGELVPQDPNDEPASVLLERIKAHRSNQAAINPKRSRKAMA